MNINKKVYASFGAVALTGLSVHCHGYSCLYLNYPTKQKALQIFI